MFIFETILANVIGKNCLKSKTKLELHVVLNNNITHIA